jgi:MinD-like ATPase involved in chromosome partitioning or flagellar assembly
MSTIYIVDKTAESRNRVQHYVSSSLSSIQNSIYFYSKINIKAVTPNEIQYQLPPEICIIGKEIDLFSRDIKIIKEIRKQFPETVLLLEVKEVQVTLELLEEAKLIGIDDIITDSDKPVELLKKIVLLKKEAREKEEGKILLFESGKGGVGVTSLAASYAREIAALGANVVVVDLDFETQDLSRFLQIRPYINEHLQLLLYQHRPFIEENILQSSIPFFDGEERLAIVPPPPEDEDLNDTMKIPGKFLIRYIHALKSLYDIVVIDSGSVRGSAKKQLVKSSDRVFLVTTNDPASFYPSAARLKQILPLVSDKNSIAIIENNIKKSPYIHEVFKKELLRQGGLVHENSEFKENYFTINFCKKGALWAGSGYTLAENAGIALRKSLHKIVMQTGNTIVTNSSIEEQQINNEYIQKPSYLQLISQRVKRVNLPFLSKKKEVCSSSREIQGSNYKPRKLIVNTEFLPSTLPERQIELVSGARVIGGS